MTSLEEENFAKIRRNLLVVSTAIIFSHFLGVNASKIESIKLLNAEVVIENPHNILLVVFILLFYCTYRFWCSFHKNNLWHLYLQELIKLIEDNSYSFAHKRTKKIAGKFSVDLLRHNHSFSAVTHVIRNIDHLMAHFDKDLLTKAANVSGYNLWRIRIFAFGETVLINPIFSDAFLPFITTVYSFFILISAMV